MNSSIKSSRGISSYRIWKKKNKTPMMMGNEARVMAGSPVQLSLCISTLREQPDAPGREATS